MQTLASFVVLVALLAIVVLGILMVALMAVVVQRVFALLSAQHAILSTKTPEPVQPEKIEQKTAELPKEKPVEAPVVQEAPVPQAPTVVASAYCGYCGKPIEGDPVRALDLADQAFLGYACSACHKETMVIRSDR